MGEVIIVIEGLTKLTNSYKRQSWHIKAREAKKWKTIVHAHCNELKISELNLKKAKITIIRQSSREPDFDGLVSGGKHLLDGLVEAQVIIDDKMSVIGQPQYVWEYRPRKQGGRVLIKVEYA